MLRFGTKRRTIHVHLGPHKTGSTAIQHTLRDISGVLTRDFNTTPILDRPVWALAKALNARDERETDRAFSDVTKLCKKHPGDLILSCEDLAGNLADNPAVINDQYALAGQRRGAV